MDTIASINDSSLINNRKLLKLINGNKKNNGINMLIIIITVITLVCFIFVYISDKKQIRNTNDDIYELNYE